MSFPVRMQTGFNNGADDTWATNYINEHIILLTIFMEDAMKLATTYSEHAGRQGIHSTDIILALKTRAIFGDAFWNNPNIQERINDIRNEVINDDDLEEMNDDNLEEFEEFEEDNEMNDGDEMNISQVEEPWTKSNHNCPICEALNDVDTKWDQWNPEDKRIKDAINFTIEKIGSNQ